MRNQYLNVPGLLTRNNSIDCHEYKTSSNLQKKQIFDAVAAASIVNNCSGVDTSKSQVITLATFTKFLESRQQEKLSDEEIKTLVKVNVYWIQKFLHLKKYLIDNLISPTSFFFAEINILITRCTRLTCLLLISRKKNLSLKIKAIFPFISE